MNNGGARGKDAPIDPIGEGLLLRKVVAGRGGARIAGSYRAMWPRKQRTKRGRLLCARVFNVWHGSLWQLGIDPALYAGLRGSGKRSSGLV